MDQKIARLSIDLDLRQRKDVQNIDTPGQRLTSLWQRGVPGGPGKHVASRTQVPVEFGLDCLKQLGHVLILVDQDWPRTTDESPWIIAHRSSGRRIVAVRDGSA